MLNDELVYPNVNNGVYRCGFAKSQNAYDAAVAGLFEALEDLDKRLASRRFLGGDKFSWLDLRLYHTLVRFDPVYVVYFKTNVKRIADYPNLGEFCAGRLPVRRAGAPRDDIKPCTMLPYTGTRRSTPHRHHPGVDGARPRGGARPRRGRRGLLHALAGAIVIGKPPSCEWGAGNEQGWPARPARCKVAKDLASQAFARLKHARADLSTQLR